MPVPSNDSGLRDNHTRGSVADFLRAKIQTGTKLSVVSAYFTIYAYDALKDYLGTIDHLDFLFGEPSFVKRLDPSKTQTQADCGFQPPRARVSTSHVLPSSALVSAALSALRWLLVYCGSG